MRSFSSHAAGMSGLSIRPGRLRESRLFCLLPNRLCTGASWRRCPTTRFLPKSSFYRPYASSAGHGMRASGIASVSCRSTSWWLAPRPRLSLPSNSTMRHTMTRSAGLLMHARLTRLSPRGYPYSFGRSAKCRMYRRSERPSPRPLGLIDGCHRHHPCAGMARQNPCGPQTPGMQ